ncbi:hypothetical protein SEA_MADAMATO_68 [Streptomyces phage Madamato]|nr:hypothetical protein SEA_MADAMATO_68 [Streptomyces phage Madamato]
MKGPFKLFVEGGHAFKTDESGKLEWWDHDHCDGYICILCGETLCRGCEPDWKTEPCPDNNAPVIPGLELEVTP